MCGIIGFCGPNTPESRKLLANLIRESSYRGLHSMGVASFNGESLDNHQLELTGLEESLMWMTVGVPDLRIIAHTRYCTSDPDSPLPIVEDGRALVLNGVITQEPFDTWPLFGGAPYRTRNDAEIMLRLNSQGNPHETPGSYAACLLTNFGSIYGVRSPERPMWWHSFHFLVEGSVAYVFTSTLDIANRAAGGEARKMASRELLPGTVVCLNDSQQVVQWTTGPELQKPHTKVKPCKL